LPQALASGAADFVEYGIGSGGPEGDEKYGQDGIAVEEGGEPAEYGPAADHGGDPECESADHVKGCFHGIDIISGNVV